ncbi:MAG TPA: TerB family tellurite resistance protein [Gammaproteobacteria bacterium]|nr:TerB family tellurite resistance protein [Gammaproteobacteria bacterium]
MLKALSGFLDKAFRTDVVQASETREHALQVATALLLIEVARADHQEDLTEDAAVFALIKDFFELSESECAMLIDEASRQADHATSLQIFTRRLHEQLTMGEKLRVVEMLWKVALADERLDKHEDYVVRKVADLLYISHRDLIRIRNQIRNA